MCAIYTTIKLTLALPVWVMSHVLARRYACEPHSLLGVLYSVVYCNDSTLIWASIVSMYKAVSFFCRGDIKSGIVTYLSTESQERWRNTLFWIVLEKAVFTCCLDLLLIQRVAHGKAPWIARILWLVVLKSLNMERLSTINCTVCCVWIFPCGKTCKCRWRTKSHLQAERNARTWWIICRDMSRNITTGKEPALYVYRYMGSE